MNKEVKRYDPLAGLARNAKLRRMEMQCDPQWVLDLLAERDAAQKDAERYRWLLRQAWFQSAFDRYDFDDGGMQHRFERCAAEIIDAALQGEQP